MSFTLNLNDSEKKVLLQIARDSILHYLARIDLPSLNCDAPPCNKFRRFL